MSATLLCLADYRKREPVMFDIFGPIELAAGFQIFCLFSLIALCRIATDGLRAGAPRR